MNPYNMPSANPAPRSGRNRLLRIVLLVFLPPVAAVMTWRSRRVHIAAKVLLTVCCLSMSLLWLGVIISPSPKSGAPTPAANTAAPASSPTPTPSDSPTPSTTLTATPSPTPTPENPKPTPTRPPVYETQSPIVVPTTETVTPEPERTSAPAAVYFKNCDEAKAAGAAPLHRGDPGYRSGLDRDGDGVACER
ncbi:excalibur calcium-binding domain-containing protein [Kitasatospora camelliae]|uniref:Excalibur calcium-binding domain-containing protein n=1 Tax=Kitasatospora camelliae TaxID=3156397 RepID=A0AAU8K1A4_9ACTN